MDDKLEEFVALLRRPGPRPLGPRPRPRPPVPAAARLLKSPSIRLPDWALALATPSPRLWVNLGCGAAALAVIAIATWLALPPAREAPLVAANAPPPPPAAAIAAAPAPPAPAAAKITLPFPALAPEEQGEITAPAPPVKSQPPLPPETKLAALTPAPAPAARRGEPAWLRFAVPVPPAHGRPEIAIVIDDTGLDKKGAERAIALPGPLTISLMAYATDLPRLAAEAHRAGHELMLHVPMQPISSSEDMGPNGLSVDLSTDQILQRLRWDLGRFDGYVGINNHMGSRFTADAAGMAPVMAELKARGLLFLDSRTIGDSVGIELARKYGVPHAARDVFLDNEIEPHAIAARLAETEEIARRHGRAIAIGHPHDATLDQLAQWLPTLAAKGFVLVPVSTIVRQHIQLAGGSG